MKRRKLAKRLAFLSRSNYPPEMVDSVEDILEYLDMFEEQDFLQIFQVNGKDVAELIATREGNRVDIWSFSILKGYRTNRTLLTEILSSFDAWLKEDDLVSAECRETSYRVVRRRFRIVSEETVPGYWDSDEVAHVVTFKKRS